MLNTLRKIVQEVNSAKDLKAALGIIVQRVKEAMGTQVCSVYLLDTETQRFVLMATEGLNKRSIGKVSMAPAKAWSAWSAPARSRSTWRTPPPTRATAISPRPARSATRRSSARRSSTIGG